MGLIIPASLGDHLPTAKYVTCLGVDIFAEDAFFEKVAALAPVASKLETKKW